MEVGRITAVADSQTIKFWKIISCSEDIPPFQPKIVPEENKTEDNQNRFFWWLDERNQLKGLMATLFTAKEEGQCPKRIKCMNKHISETCLCCMAISYELHGQNIRTNLLQMDADCSELGNYTLSVLLKRIMLKWIQCGDGNHFVIFQSAFLYDDTTGIADLPITFKYSVQFYSKRTNHCIAILDNLIKLVNNDSFCQREVFQIQATSRNKVTGFDFWRFPKEDNDKDFFDETWETLKGRENIKELCGNNSSVLADINDKTYWLKAKFDWVHGNFDFDYISGLSKNTFSAGRWDDLYMLVPTNLGGSKELSNVHPLSAAQYQSGPLLNHLHGTIVKWLTQYADYNPIVELKALFYFPKVLRKRRPYMMKYLVKFYCLSPVGETNLFDNFFSAFEENSLPFINQVEMRSRIKKGVEIALSVIPVVGGVKDVVEGIANYTKGNTVAGVGGIVMGVASVGADVASLGVMSAVKQGAKEGGKVIGKAVAKAVVRNLAVVAINEVSSHCDGCSCDKCAK